jgi:glutathione synthase/RimK-type ligase-like ATP-grasp enzyme
LQVLQGSICEGCYQLIGVDIMFDASLRPVVIEVNGLPSMQLGDDTGAVDEQMECVFTHPI